MTLTPVSPDTKIDLTNCDREPIHILGNVQQFGCLIAVDSHWLVQHVSQNVQDYLGHDAEAMIGQPLSDYLGDEARHEIRTRVQQLNTDHAVERIFGMRIDDTQDTPFNIGVHMSRGCVVLELEPQAVAPRKDYTGYVRPMMQQVRRAGSVEGLCKIAARQIKALTGFDRVMVYRFAPDQSGEVVAEAVRSGIDSFLGLHYPASDIPQQARELYRRNLLRIISDVNETVSPILPQNGPDGEPLDLSMSGLRAVSPIHIEYLKNMGVDASLSISILRRGKLWGLFACHHYSPKTLSFEIRTAAELFAEMFSFLLDQALNDEAAAHSALTQSLHDEMMARLAGGNSVKKHFPAIAEALSSVIPNAGVAAWLDGEFLAQGQTPHEGDVRDLVGFLERTGVRGVYSTEKLGEVYAPARDYTDCAAGLLAIPVSRMGGDYVLLFREEITKTVSWGGNPEKPVSYGPNGPRLTPRKSFEEWKETVRGHSAPWTEAEIGAAEQLRVTLLEVVLRLADEASQERARAHERQELLIAELNHRVRNILNLIRGLVTQSARDACTAEELSEMVGGRIQALARAHDQITLQNWAPASVRQLIRTELEAYFGEKAGRIRLSGPDALIQPAAFSTLSLVIHELATNSAKYGALSDSRGSIEVTLSPTESDGLALSWRESGGPPVQAPTRQGFGTTIIENSVPFELRGTAELHFELTGLEADFTIPSSHVHAFQTVEDEESERSTTLERKAPPQARFNGPALVLEDNMIIALDAEELVSQLGATSVTVCAGVEEALGAVERNDFAFALLDVNLGRETSEPVAEALRERGVPFAFATGYGEAASLVSRFPDAPVLKKPYREDMLSAVVEQALQAPGG